MSGDKKGIHRLEWSAILTILGVIILFSSAILVTLIAPNYVDPSWRQASSEYQVQMYRVSDPNVYISTSTPRGFGLQYIYHIKEGFTLTAFQESEATKIFAPPDLEKYVTRLDDPMLKLTSRVLLLRKYQKEKELQSSLQEEWKTLHLDWETTGIPFFDILELYDPQQEEVFAVTESDGVIEFWADKNFTILGKTPPYFIDKGVIYVNNPKEYRKSEVLYRGKSYWLYNENGQPVKEAGELQSEKMRFLSREALIGIGQDIFRIEGCWYCHTDQTRTLVQDTVLNGSADFPAPPSSANEYIFQSVTFPGTRRIGPDLSRVGVKRPNRDWHMSHFWEPRSESKGSVMPSFRHFFETDPAGSAASPFDVPNYLFEAVFQYLMTKGTRITSPNQAWWLGLDPVQTLDIIEGRK